MPNVERREVKFVVMLEMDLGFGLKCYSNMYIAEPQGKKGVLIKNLIRHNKYKKTLHRTNKIPMAYIKTL